MAAAGHASVTVDTQAAACWLTAQGSSWGRGTLEHNIVAGHGTGNVTQGLDGLLKGLG